ncbi:anthrone oxygenase family protein [Oerskovia sp. M15]
MDALGVLGWALVAAVVGSALTGGVLFAFSTFVMAGLRSVAPEVGAAAMASINRHATKAPFGSLLLVTTGLVAVLGVVAATRLDAAGMPLVLAGAVVYLVGGIGVTAAANVPLNDRLEAADVAAAAEASRSGEVSSSAGGSGGVRVRPSPTAERDQVWAAFLGRWVAWNHVRTLACVVAALLLTLGLVTRLGGERRRRAGPRSLSAEFLRETPGESRKNSALSGGTQE